MSQHRSPNSRIFLGNLPSERTSKEELYEVFGKYGKIEDIVLRRSFGFIQFDSADAAKAAITNENGRVIGGMRVDINMADNREPKRKGEKEEKRRDRSPESGTRRKRSPSPEQRGKRQEVESEPAVIYCMLIHLGPSQRDYAARVEQMIKRDVGGVECELGLVERKAVPEAIAKHKKRGFSYVCVMGRQNEQKQTLALHILHPDKPDEVLTEVNNREAVDLIRRDIAKSQKLSTNVSSPSIAINPAMMPLLVSMLGLPPTTVIDSSMIPTLQQLLLVQSALASVQQQTIPQSVPTPQMLPSTTVPTTQVPSVSSPQLLPQQMLQAQLMNLMSKQSTPTAAPSSSSPAFSTGSVSGLSGYGVPSNPPSVKPTWTNPTPSGNVSQSPSTSSFLASLSQNTVNPQTPQDQPNWLNTRWAQPQIQPTSTVQSTVPSYQPSSVGYNPSAQPSSVGYNPSAQPPSVGYNPSSQPQPLSKNSDLLQSLLSKMSQSSSNPDLGSTTQPSLGSYSVSPVQQPQRGGSQDMREQALLSILQKTARSGSAPSESSYSTDRKSVV